MGLKSLQTANMSNNEIVLNEAILTDSSDAACYEHFSNAGVMNILTIWTLDGRNDQISAE